MSMRLTAAQVRVIHEHMLAGLTVGDVRGMVKIDGLAHSVGCTTRAALHIIRRFMENTPSDKWVEALERELAGVCIRSVASRGIGPRVHTSMASTLLERCSQNGGYGDEQCRFGAADFDRMDQEFGISKSRTQVATAPLWLTPWLLYSGPLAPL
jgi:hypothetical protein